MGDECFLFPSVVFLATGLQYIWENRKNKVATPLFLKRDEPEAAVSIRRNSSAERIKESASIMENMIKNFSSEISVD